VAERLRVREIDDDQGRRLVRITKAGSRGQHCGCVALPGGICSGRALALGGVLLPDQVADQG
jgi:hypothetical protein